MPIFLITNKQELIKIWRIKSKTVSDINANK